MARPRTTSLALEDINEPIRRTLQTLGQMEIIAEDPDAPMPIAINAKLNENASATKLYEGSGDLRMVFSRELMKRAFKYRNRIWSAEEAESLCEDYFEDCRICQMPATIGGLALYLGTTQKDVENQIVAAKPCAPVLVRAKEAIRMAMEMAAIDGSINPLIYFHQQGAYAGYNQKTEVSITTPLRLDPSETEIADIVATLPDALPPADQGNDK